MASRITTFGDFIADKRLQQGIGLRDMAKRLEVSAPYLSDVEKNRRNPLDKEKLDQLAQILNLSDADRVRMYDFAGKSRNTVAPDLPEYIMGNRAVGIALRTARDLDASEAEWMEFVKDLKERHKSTERTAANEKTRAAHRKEPSSDTE